MRMTRETVASEREKDKFGARLCVAAKVSRSVIDRLSMPPTREDEEREKITLWNKKIHRRAREWSRHTQFSNCGISGFLLLVPLFNYIHSILSAEIWARNPSLSVHRTWWWWVERSRSRQRSRSCCFWVRMWEFKIQDICVTIIDDTLSPIIGCLSSDSVNWLWKTCWRQRD